MDKEKMTNTSQVKIKTVIVKAFARLYKYKKELFKALLIPILFFIAIEWVLLLDLNKISYAVIFIINITIRMRIAITTHRIMLLGPLSVPTWGIKKWTIRETLFLFYFGLFTGLMYMPDLIIRVLVQILSRIHYGTVSFLFFDHSIMTYTVLISIMFFFASRLSLVFPAIAVDKAVSFRRSWEMTRDYKLFMFLVVFVTPIIIFLPVIVLMVFFSTYAFVVQSFLLTALIVVGIALLSFAYKLIAEQETHDPNNPAI